MFSSSSYAEWTKVDENVFGSTYYVDFERIREVDRHAYFWRLSNYLTPLEGGYLSSKIYRQGDCKSFRFKNLSFSFHTEPMGGGDGDTDNESDKEWTYPNYESVDETILKSVCANTR
jgi:hypothetical protein